MRLARRRLQRPNSRASSLPAARGNTRPKSGDVAWRAQCGFSACGRTTFFAAINAQCVDTASAGRGFDDIFDAWRAARIGDGSEVKVSRRKREFVPAFRNVAFSDVRLISTIARQAEPVALLLDRP